MATYAKQLRIPYPRRQSCRRNRLLLCSLLSIRHARSHHWYASIDLMWSVWTGSSFSIYGSVATAVNAFAGRSLSLADRLTCKASTNRVSESSSRGLPCLRRTPFRSALFYVCHSYVAARRDPLVSCAAERVLRSSAAMSIHHRRQHSARLVFRPLRTIQCGEYFASG